MWWGFNGSFVVLSCSASDKHGHPSTERLLCLDFTRRTVNLESERVGFLSHVFPFSSFRDVVVPLLDLVFMALGVPGWGDFFVSS